MRKGRDRLSAGCRQTLEPASPTSLYGRLRPVVPISLSLQAFSPASYSGSLRHTQSLLLRQSCSSTGLALAHSPPARPHHIHSPPPLDFSLFTVSYGSNCSSTASTTSTPPTDLPLSFLVTTPRPSSRPSKHRNSHVPAGTAHPLRLCPRRRPWSHFLQCVSLRPSNLHASAA